MAARDDGGADVRAVGNVLFGYRSQFLLKNCRAILSKTPPFYHRRKKATETEGDPGSFFSFNVKDPATKQIHPHRAPKIFLSELCQEQGLTAHSPKEELINQLLLRYAKQPDALPDVVLELLTGDLFLGIPNPYKAEWERAVGFDNSLNFELSRINEADSLNFEHFSETFKQLAFLAHKLSWFPRNEDTFYLLHLEL
jgi:hypothetical protein